MAAEGPLAPQPRSLGPMRVRAPAPSSTSTAITKAALRWRLSDSWMSSGGRVRKNRPV